jgi:hypothetical protein
VRAETDAHIELLADSTHRPGSYTISPADFNGISAPRDRFPSSVTFNGSSHISKKQRENVEAVGKQL